MEEHEEQRGQEDRESKPPEEPHPDEPRGTSLPPAEESAADPDPEETGEPAESDGSEESAPGGAA
jgi:hypothetical protein